MKGVTNFRTEGDAGHASRSAPQLLKNFQKQVETE